MIDRATEMGRFNAITKEEAERLANLCENQYPALRSCWNCNGAHEHLNAEGVVIRCFVCGVLYVSGVPAPILAMRMRGEAIADADMDKYEQALASAD